jgi:hemoglobin
MTGAACKRAALFYFEIRFYAPTVLLANGEPQFKQLQERYRMKRRIPALLLLTVMAFASLAPAYAAAPPAAATADTTLYKRLGGYDALAAVTDDFLGRLATDPQLGRFFKGLSTDSQKRVRQHVIDFLCNATGGPCAYVGRDMKTAHTGLNITEDDWNSSVKALVATLDKFKVPDREKNEVLATISGLKGDIVGH